VKRRFGPKKDFFCIREKIEKRKGEIPYIEKFVGIFILDSAWK
jgi:hypothetical protein